MRGRGREGRDWGRQEGTGDGGVLGMKKNICKCKCEFKCHDVYIYLESAE